MHSKKIDADVALALRNQGHSLQQIADRFGVSKQRVQQILGRTGHASDELRANLMEWRRRYHMEGLPLAEICDRFQISETYATTLLWSFNRYLRSQNLRRCNWCHVIKPVAEFYNGRCSVCKACNTEAHRFYTRRQRHEQLLTVKPTKEPDGPPYAIDPGR